MAVKFIVCTTFKVKLSGRLRYFLHFASELISTKFVAINFTKSCRTCNWKYTATRPKMIDSTSLLTEFSLSSKNRVYLDLLTPTWAMPWKFASLLVRWTTSDNGCQVLVIQCVLFRLIWSKRVLYGIWEENMHEVLMKTMCSNHSHTL